MSTLRLRLGFTCGVCSEPISVRPLDGIQLGQDDVSISILPHRCSEKVLRGIAEEDGVADPDELFASLKKEALL